MFKLAVFLALVACAFAAPGLPVATTYDAYNAYQTVAAAPVAYAAAPVAYAAAPAAYGAYAHPAPVAYAAHAAPLGYAAYPAPAQVAYAAYH